MINTRKSPDYINDPLFGNGGFFFFPFSTSLAKNILDLVQEGGLYFYSSEDEDEENVQVHTNSATFLKAHAEELSGAGNMIQWFSDNNRVTPIGDYNFPAYRFSNPADEKTYKKMLSDFNPVKEVLQSWPLTTLLMSCIYRLYVKKSYPYQDNLWDLCVLLKNEDPKINPVKAALQANQFDQALLLSFSYNAKTLEEDKQVKVAEKSFWPKILRSIFFDSDVDSVAIKCLKEFRDFAKRNPSFKTEHFALGETLFYRLDRGLFRNDNIYELSPQEVVFISLQTVTLLEVLNIDLGDAKASLYFSIKNKSSKSLKDLLEAELK